MEYSFINYSDLKIELSQGGKENDNTADTSRDVAEQVVPILATWKHTV